MTDSLVSRERMTFGSVCSGIEAASVAWAPLGWRCAFMAEIEAFPRAVLAHHYGDVPLHGDFTTIQPGDYERIDLLVGGTPCQSFSVAGLRGGMADDRGNLALQFLALAGRLRPVWVVWENVPGVLSSTGGRDFGSFLGGLGELGYGWAYRTLDAQHFGVPQRRRRVFVVGYLGDWRRAAAVLFERHCLSGHPAPSREAGQGVARPIAAGSPAGSGYRNDADTADNLIASLDLENMGAGGNIGFAEPAEPTITLNTSGNIGIARGLDSADVAKCLSASHTASHTASGRQDPSAETYVTHSLRAAGFDASEDGTGRGTPLVIGFSNVSDGSSARNADHLSDTLSCRHGDPGMVALSFALRGREGGAMPEVGDGAASALRSASGGSTRDYVAFDWNNSAGAPNSEETFGTLATERSMAIGTVSAVRRLTPRECARLQGFPDDYLDILYRGKPAADGPKYKALGNSMAVPCMAWLGSRIAAVAALPFDGVGYGSHVHTRSQTSPHLARIAMEGGER